MRPITWAMALSVRLPPPRRSAARLTLGSLFAPATLLLVGNAVRIADGQMMLLAAMTGLATLALLSPFALPEWVYPPLVALGTVVIATTFSIGIPADEAILYLWPAFYAAYFFSARMAVAQVVWILICHATMLTMWDLPGDHAARLVNVGVSLGVGVWLVTAMRRRLDELVAALARAATTDELTGVLNRRGFGERLGAEIARARRTGAPLSLVLLDVDHFKRVNDGAGHSAGDRLLTAIGAALRSTTRGQDVAARLGGEEFAVLAPDTPAPAGHELAERLRGAMADSSHAVGLPVTASAGVSTWAGAGPLDPDTLLTSADQALYRAKDDGRDTVRAA